MYEVETLEARLRKRASEQLKRELEQAAEPLLKFARTGYIVPLQKVVWAQGVNGEGKNVSAAHAIHAVIEELHAVWLPSKQDDAIRTFLEKVDTLQIELDELKNSVAEGQ